MGSPNHGDRVRIDAATPEGPVTHEGILLAPATGGHITVKLDNGYNVTFLETEITEITLIAVQAIEEQIFEVNPTENMDLPEVWILHLSLIHI